jgi:YfiH family protein
MITLPALDGSDRIRHGFFTRNGGVSEGIYASLNCGLGSRDDPDAVAENRARAAAAFGLRSEDLLTLYQVHSPNVVVVTERWKAGETPRADAMVTAEPGIMLGSLGADCAAILFADAEAGVIAAAHAGWRGAKGGVLEAAVTAMRRLGAAPERIRAGIGPCIGARSYEVGSEFRAEFLVESEDNGRFFTPASTPAKFLFDLVGYIETRLRRLSLQAVEACRSDTVAEDDAFFSYRRSTLRGEPDYGRNLSAIALLP